MKTENLDDYELFYVELPPADYLNDIEIQDEYEQTDYDSVQGLTDQQVRDLADDSLDVAEADPQTNWVPPSPAQAEQLSL